MNVMANRAGFGVVVLIALVAGFGLARWADPHDDVSAALGARQDAAAVSAGEEDRAGHPAGDEPAGEEGPDGVVALTRRQIEASGITVVAAGRGGGNETRLTGRVEPAVEARAAVAATVGGRVERVMVSPGVPVRAGQTLAVLTSGDAASLRASADAAAAEAEAARLVLQRDMALVEQGVVARQELEASRARSLAAEATARAAEAQVGAAGSPDERGRVVVTSPMAGVVGSVQVTPGGFIASGGIVAEISDPGRTELVFVAPPALAAQVRPGVRVDVTGPVGSFEATVVGVAAGARESNGAAIIRARPVSGSLPPSGSPVAGTVVIGGVGEGVTVPADAVQTVDGQSVVFVSTPDGFRVTPVLVGHRAGGHIEILRGLAGSERIAAANAFLLKAELARGEAQHGH